jgi:hypothetical protein
LGIEAHSHSPWFSAGFGPKLDPSFGSKLTPDFGEKPTRSLAKAGSILYA